ncbi:hypothetical protein GGR51DRAFT_542350 [Nemania sp. FL0031]|nr:hypothetical protein GGR51DRAFT_542350 [Nemania sp. FL0031]
MSSSTIPSTSSSSKAAPKRYTIELGQHQCIAILKECYNNKSVRVVSATGCALYEGKLTRDGHWQIQRKPRYFTRASNRSSESKNAHKAYYVHRIAYVALHGSDITMTGSHLCGNANCFNPYHIYDESQMDNNSRQRCLGFIICPHHRLVLHQLCQHAPVCIKEPIFASQCCLSATQKHLMPSGENNKRIIGLPLVQRIEDFLFAQHDLSESEFTSFSEKSCQY